MKLLIIDDSIQIRSAIKKSLSLIPQINSILEAADVETGISIVKNENPEIVILDLMLKTGTGIDFLKLLEYENQSPVVLLYSSYLSSEYKKLAKSFGVKYCFDKSSDIMQLINAIKNIIT